MEFNNGKIMGSVLEKSLAIVELLVDYPEGLPVSAIAQATDQPASGVHRTLQELTRLGYVRQAQAHGDYALTIRMSAMGLGFLGRAGITDVAQPVLDRLAADCGELIRLSIIDGDDLIWVAVAQGGTRGLRYDPGQEQGVVVHLASAAGGLAWLSTMGDDEALTRVSRQGLIREADNSGSRAPQTLTELLARLSEARERGYSIAVDSYLVGMAAMAVPIRYRGGDTVIGCLSIAGPTARLDPAWMADHAGMLKDAAAELGDAALGFRYFSCNSGLLAKAAG